MPAIRKVNCFLIIFIFTFILFFSCMISIRAFASDQINEDGFLKTDGKVIKNRNGDIVTLRGTNMGGWLVQESWMTPTNSPYQKETVRVLSERFGEQVKDRLIDTYEDNYITEADLDYVRDMGMNALRLPFSYMNLVDGNGRIKADAWDRIDWFIENCAKRGMYVILDLHGAEGSQNGKDHSGDASNGAQLFGNEKYIADTVALWEAVAARYKGNPAVAAYDLLNEPAGNNNKTTSMQWDVYDRIYKAVRSVDPDHIIMIESCWEPGNLPDPSQYGWENVVYEYHNYCWNADNDFQKQKDFVDQKLSAVKKANYNVPTFVGEFTAFVNADSWRYTLGKYNEAGFSWTTWTYKVTGNSSWGIKNQNVPKVDIYNDTAEEITEKWSHAGESAENKKYADIIREYLTGSTKLPEESQPAAKLAPAWYLGPECETVLNAGAAATAKITDIDGKKAIELTTSETRDPGSAMQCVGISPQSGKPQDASGYLYLVFEIKDTQGSNTHKITMKDDKGRAASVWSSASSTRNEWVNIPVPLSSFDGVDLSKIAEIRIGEWNAGTYYIRNLYFTQNEDGEMPANSRHNSGLASPSPSPSPAIPATDQAPAGKGLSPIPIAAAAIAAICIISLFVLRLKNRK